MMPITEESQKDVVFLIKILPKCCQLIVHWDIIIFVIAK